MNRYHLRKIARQAGIEKDVHPHVFRHYFTTIAKTKYGLDDAYIKHLRGDSPGSIVMETTYRHLSDEDAIENVRARRERREPFADIPLSPDSACPKCEVHVPPNSKACFKCGIVFTPDAIAV